MGGVQSDHPAPDPLTTLRGMAADAEVFVFDLDGVVRDFDLATTREVTARIGLTSEEFFTIAFHETRLGAVIVGAITFAQWRSSICGGLVEHGIDAEDARRAVDAWIADRGTPIRPTVALIEELQRAGKRVFLFTNGTDNIPAELHQIGLGHLAGVALNSADFGVAKPDPGAYAAAHAAVERHLERPVTRSAVVFTDDRLPNVEAAERFGWRAVHFRGVVNPGLRSS